METLMTSAAFVTAACSSGREDGIGSSSSPRDAGTGSSEPRPIRTSGYQVVDPVPRPSRCSTIAAGAVSASSSVVTRNDGRWDIVMTFKPTDPSVKVRSAAHAYHRSAPSGQGAPEFKETPDGATVTTTVDPKTSESLRLFVGVSCGQEFWEIDAAVHWTEKGAPPAAPPVTLAPVATVVWGGSSPYGIH
ncbi:MAG: hypothetical protein U0414_18365 [Polyangiaceae bacterium]